MQGEALYAMELALSLEKLNFTKLRELWRIATEAADGQLTDFIGVPLAFVNLSCMCWWSIYHMLHSTGCSHALPGTQKTGLIYWLIYWHLLVQCPDNMLGGSGQASPCYAKVTIASLLASPR